MLTALDRLGLRDHTIVVFLSDNGGIDLAYSARPFAAQTATLPTPTTLEVERREFSNAPLRMGKGSHYEGGIRVPCLVRWPSVTPPGKISDVPIHVIDWLPTFFAVAGAKAPMHHPVDGVDLGPVLRGGRGTERALFWYLPFYELRWGATPAAVVRDGAGRTNACVYRVRRQQLSVQDAGTIAQRSSIRSCCTMREAKNVE